MDRRTDQTVKNLVERFKANGKKQFDFSMDDFLKAWGGDLKPHHFPAAPGVLNRWSVELVNVFETVKNELRFIHKIDLLVDAESGRLVVTILDKQTEKKLKQFRHGYLKTRQSD